MFSIFKTYLNVLDTLVSILFNSTPTIWCIMTELKLSWNALKCGTLGALCARSWFLRSCTIYCTWKCESIHTRKDWEVKCTRMRIIVRWQTKMADLTAVSKNSSIFVVLGKTQHLKQCPCSTEAVSIAVWPPHSVGLQISLNRETHTHTHTHTDQLQ